MRIDQTLMSLRPGGGVCPRSTRFFAPRFESSPSSSAESHTLRPAFKAGELRFEGHEYVWYTREQLLQLKKVADIPNDILNMKQEIECEFAGEDQTWGRADGNLQAQPQSRYSEPDNRGWRGRSAAPGDERSWDTIRDNKEVSSHSDSRLWEMNNRQKDLNSQFARAQISSSQR